jgi:hypothetical protein
MMAPSLRKQLRVGWPSIRAALLLFHVIAVLVLSFPSAYRLADRSRWKDQRTRRELALWAERLSGWGIDTDVERLDARLWSLAQGYLGVRETIAAPFQPYRDIGCVTQTWGMFRSPQRRPGELWVSLREGGSFRTVHVSRSDEHDYLAIELEHNRMRKLVARALTDGALFGQIAHFIARRAAHDFPDASDVIVELRRFESQPPEARRKAAPAPRLPHRRLRLALEPLR